jgi:hypothetical protein
LALSDDRTKTIVAATGRESMLEKLRKLIELGTGEFELFDAQHLATLDSTRCLLKAWAATDTLQQAGLYHLVYVFTSKLSDGDNRALIEQRKAVSVLLGADVEAIIYYYHACDFSHLLEQPLNTAILDRFIGQNIILDETKFRDVCELAVAIEVERVLAKNQEYGSNQLFLQQMLTKMQPFLSRAAKNKLYQICDLHIAQTNP